MLDLYFWPTPNGKKVTILLEECGLPYTIKPVNIGRGDQFHAGFLRIAPNNRMPALVDTEPLGGGAPISIFESAAIMMYLAEKAGRFYPQETRRKYEVTQWLMWQMANQGPKMGEQGHFRRAAEDPRNGDQSYAIRRFDNEVHRLFGVLNLGLHGKSWLAAGEYTIADMICYPWASYWHMRGIDLEEFPNAARWLEAVAARPAVVRGMAVGQELAEDLTKLGADEKERRAKILSNQRAVPVPKEWVGGA
ncbi:MAG TPA: glutathione S-transferase N-terminal domain-containing protein [Gammaproteobacteria bacterium]|nr:glutathione S-transferase N-terminal domain-containing protein [Gammaproteobacteria bacterium]